MKIITGKTRKEVVAEYPSAVKIIKVSGGYAVFATWTDFETWKNQK